MKYFLKRTVLFLAVFLLSFVYSSVFAQTDIDENNNIISVDTVWTKDASPYVVYQDVLVDIGTTLTIEAGTIIKLESGRNINIFGNLIVQGTEVEKVYFTSLYDDSIGGDTDGDGGIYEAYNSDWNGLFIFGGGKINMDNSEILYTSDALSFNHSTGVLNSVRIANCQNAIDMYESNLSLNNSLIEDISNDAIFSYSMGILSINGSTFKNIDGDVIVAGNNNKVSFYNSTIENVINGYSISIWDKSSVDIENSNIKNISKGFDVYINSSFTLKNSIIDGVTNGGWAMLPIYNNSILTISSSTIKNVSADSIIQAFNNVEANILDLSVEDIFTDNVFEIYGGSEEYATTTFNISDSTLIGGDGNAFQIFSKVKANILNVKIKDFSGIGIETFSYPEIKVVGSEISGNDIGIVSYGSDLEINNSSIKDNKTFGIYNFSAEDVPSIKATNNWWGDKSGPFNILSNATGTGNIISENVLYLPWLLSDPSQKRNPVIIIPGILSSYLNKNDYTKEEVWLNLVKAMSSGDDSYLDDLLLTKFGEPDLTKKLVLPTDIFRKIKVSSLVENDFFDGLIKQLESSGYKEGKDLFVFPYDWRLDIRDIVDNSYTPLTPSLKDKIDEILQKTNSEKIDIIAHSMGGLVSKYYIKNYGLGKIDKFIDIATPHLGSPGAFNTLVSGDDLDINYFIFGLNKNKVKEISQNMPSVYQLLPSQSYFSTTSLDYKYYIDDLDDYDENNIKGKLSFEESNNFIKNIGRNSYVMDKSIKIHDDIDTFDSKGYGIRSYNIVGCGIPTIGKYFTLGKQSESDPEFDIAYISGDGTVPQRSAEALISADRYYKTGVKHPVLSSSDGVKELVSSFLNDDVKNFDYNSFNTISTSSEKCKLPSGTTLSFHSPVEVHIYDEFGNHTGPDVNGNIENNIEDISYNIFESNKFIFLPEGKKYEIKLQATNIGSFSSHIKKIEEGSPPSTSYFNDIPLTSLNTKAEVDLLNSDAVIILSKNGDGLVTQIIKPSSILSGDSLDDRVSPTTTVKIINIKESRNSWYSSSVEILFNATDTESGVLRTEYSSDNGINYIQATSSVKILKEGQNKILYRSIDKSGNIEEEKTINLNIDKTIPEFLFSVDSKEFELKIIGFDNISSTTVSVNDITKKPIKKPIFKKSKTYLYRVSDLSGLNNDLILEINSENNKILDYDIRFSNIKDSKDISVAITREFDKKGKIKSFTQTIRQGRDSIIYTYNFKNNKTIIFTRDGREISKKIYNEEKGIEFISSNGVIKIK